MRFGFVQLPKFSIGVGAGGVKVVFDPMLDLDVAKQRALYTHRINGLLINFSQRQMG